MLIRMMPTGTVLTLTTAAALAYYVHMGHATIVATIRSDGSFSGSAQNTYSDGHRTPQVQTLQGRINGGAIQAATDVGNGCSYQLILKQFP
jgi:hypothetical protein